MNRGNVFIYSVVKTKTLENTTFSRVLLYPVKIKTPCLFVHFTKGRVSVFDVQKTII